MKQRLIDASVQAMRDTTHPRLYESERGYQGTFQANLEIRLRDQGIEHGRSGQPILESEYQKLENLHHTTQRPDLILHVPAPAGEDRKVNNLSVWALKRRGSRDDADDDFKKLDLMFRQLHYLFGFWVNIDSRESWADRYNGPFRDRLIILTVDLVQATPNIEIVRF